VIIVTPRLVRPVPAGALKVPTDRVGPPNEADLLINGRTDTGVSAVPRGLIPPGSAPPPGALAPGGTAQNKPTGFEKDYGHVL
jgi:pilus assembly protein CpaC